MSGRYPWAEATTRASFEARLGRSGKMTISLKGGDDAIVRLYRNGCVWLEGGGTVRLSKLVWTPLGYQEIVSDEKDVQKRAAEALAVMDAAIAIKELDAPRNPLALLSKRLEEEQEAQRKAGTTEFQTLDPLTEKVIVSWLRDLGEDADPWDIARRIEAGEHRQG